MPKCMTSNAAILKYLWQIRGITIYLHDLSAAMTTVTKNIKQNKQLSAHSVSIEIYSGIAQFPCDNTHSLADLQCSIIITYSLDFQIV